MTQHLPTPGSDSGTWGAILNGYLQVSHAADGTLNSSVVGTPQLQDSAITNAKLDSTTQAAVTKAGSALQPSNNLSELVGSAATVRSNLGLGTAATHATSDFSAPIIDRNTYSSATGYAPGNRVIYQNGFYTNQVSSTGIDPTAGSTTTNWLYNGPASAVAPTTTTKRITQATGSPNALYPITSGSDFMQRSLFELPATTTRWRLKIANRNAQTGASYGTSATVHSVYVGTPAYADQSVSSGRWIGNCSTALTQAISTPLVIPSDGSDAISGWVSATGAQFNADVPTILSLGMTIDAVGSGVSQSDMLAYGVIGNYSGVGSATPTSLQTVFWIFDVRIEYEVPVSSNALVGFIVGASGESGYSVDGDGSLAPVPGMFTTEAWPGVMSLQQSLFTINGGLGGSRLSDWTTSSGRPWSRFDLATTIPDFAIIGVLASNDIAALSSSATEPQIEAYVGGIRAETQTVVANLRAIGINRIFMTTQLPRSFAANSTQETCRRMTNEWIRAKPLGIEAVFDFDKAVRDTEAGTTMQADLMSSDGIHLKRGGYAVLGSLPVVKARAS